ncbi:MAG TPA: shikimate dehydrogenase [Dissulfurispiraceae bacterium]|nr:shikimate dehydrogenase [Dissulfurispiraceae bacterium]
MNISGKTKIVGLFGYPVEHSLSPYMHNAAFEALGLEYCYVTYPVHPDLLEDAVKGIRALSLKGVNITVPHKERVISFLDEVDEEARFIGAVNTIQNRDGQLIGYNTDGRGFMKSLDEAGITVEGKKVLIIGTGGAARAIGFYLCKSAGKVHLYDIDIPKAEVLAGHLYAVRQNAILVDSTTIYNKPFISSMDIIINATPLGLKAGDPSPIDVALIGSDQVVCDLIYKDTPMLRAAADKGCKTMHGLGMLLWQGVIAFEIWTGIVPPVGVMKAALMERMK